MSLDSERIAGSVSDIRHSRTRLEAIIEMGEEEFLADADSQDIARVLAVERLL